MIDEKSWEDFHSAGLLWFINRTLHLYGWAIVFEYSNNKNLMRVYPARCSFRGFDVKSETEGFVKVTQYLKKNIDNLEKETLE
jgi:hypothetical protein